MCSLGLARWLCIFILCFSLGGCESRSDLEQRLDEYQWRLFNSLNIKADLPAATFSIVVYPRQRELQRPLAPVAINLLEFLRLSRCDLQRLLGQRNSSLGQVMAASQRLFYELDFIQLAPDCIAELQRLGHQALATQLEAAIALKQQQLPDVVFNAIWAGPEFQRLFSTSIPPFELSGLQQTPVALEQSLEQLAHALNQEPLSAFSPEEKVTLENALGVVASEKYMGRLLQSAVLLTQRLNGLTQVVEHQWSQRGLCPQGVVTPEARVLQRVFLRFYIGDLQPYIALLHQRGERLRMLLESMPGLNVSANTSLAVYWRSHWAETMDQSVWQQYQLAVSRHTRLWQRLLSDCALMPGAS